MKLVRNVVALVAAFGLFTAVAYAGGEGCCKAGATAKNASDKKSECCDSIASKCMPKMAMMVGEKEFACPVEAGEFAKKNNGKVVYMVADKKYDDQGKAMAAYADVLDGYVANFAKVRTQEECMASCSGHSAAATCSKGAACCKAKDGEAKAAAVAKKETKSDAKGMYCVASRCYASKDLAEAAAKKADAAMKEVAMKYEVAGKSYCCDKMAGEAMAKAGKDAKMVFCVGETKTECKIQARIALAKAKVLAAVKATEEKSEKMAKA